MAMISQPLPAEGAVDLWLLRENDAPAGLEAVALDARETALAERMATPALERRARRRRRFLRRVLAAYLGVAPEAVPLQATAGGKPVLAGEAGLHFNLSHSGDVSVLAVGRAPLGVDVERPKSFARLPEVVSYACSARESAAIFAAPDAASAFLERWVVKEAILKCRGTGLVDDLGGVDPGPLTAAPTPWKGLTLRMVRPPRDTGLHLALAVAGPADAIVWRQLLVPAAVEDEGFARPLPGLPVTMALTGAGITP